jgi:oligopeptide/dipeptide ABC transporter ATP-binding protein
MSAIHQTTPLLEVDRVRTLYPVRSGMLQRVTGHVHAVDGVSLAIAKGETLGLVGESGSGKSSLGRTILGLARPASGEVRFEGDRIDTLSASSMRPYRRRLLVVFQDPYSSLNPRMRVGDIVAEPLRNFRVARGGELARRVDSLLERVGLRKAHASRYAHEFSGGQRQRIGIARALALDPALIICDEPVSALDVSVQAQIVNLLKGLQEERGIALLFIAHDLAVVEHMSHRVAVMYLGKVVEIATRRSIFATQLHPYTQALLSAVPVPDPSARRNRILLSGDVPSAVHPPSGCRFRTRCMHATERCAAEEPLLRETLPGHWVACHLHPATNTVDAAP